MRGTALITVIVAGFAIASSTATADAPAADAPAGARIQQWLADRLEAATASARRTGAAPLTVLVHGTSARTAAAAARASGLRVTRTWDAIGVAVAGGPPDRIRTVARRRGVTYLEGDRPLVYTDATSNTATRGGEARRALRGADDRALDGRGVSVAEIDSGVDGGHPFLTGDDGASVVVANLKSICPRRSLGPDCFIDVPGNDSDTLAAGGHGTHVAGIIAGRDVSVDGEPMHGAAPGAKIVALSVGVAISVADVANGFDWVLRNHARPCGAGVSAATCPPIKVVSNSWGPAGGGDFDPRDSVVRFQRELIKTGIVTVWANGNDGGYGSANHSNPPGQDPTPGVISVAAYDDLGVGTRQGKIAEFSSRGKRGLAATYPDISAPGVKILSSCRSALPLCLKAMGGGAPSGDYVDLSGTSMAAPHIAGIVAQLFQAAPHASPGDIETALKASAYKYADGAPYERAGSYTTSNDKGVGLVDVVAAVRALTRPGSMG
ncbi:MAG TPA: S8 family serine peptidase [Streptosporangiaceae bacterium]|nr:S8 family serine peptidase [Streptosporangiaceae bacterium]